MDCGDMNDQEMNVSVLRALTRYQKCLSGDIHEADKLALSLFVNVGLISAVLDRLNKSARVTPAEFHGNMQRFLYHRALDCLELSRLGQDRLFELYSALGQMAIYRVCLAREDECYIYVSAGMTALIEQGIDEAEQALLAELGTSRQETDDLVLKYGRAYVLQCRQGLNTEAIEGLERLGENCDLDIARVGSSVEEYQAWSRAGKEAQIKKCLHFLDSKGLVSLLQNKQLTKAVLLQIESVTCVIPGLHPSDMEGVSLGWFSPPKLEPAEAGLDESDLVRLAMIARELGLDA